MGNLSLGMQFRTCEKFWESADSGLALSQNFSQIQKPHRNYFDCDSQRESPTKKTQIAESTTFCYSKSYFCHSERSEESKRNPSLRDFATQNRGNLPCKKTQDLQRGWLLRDARKFYELPRSHSLARNDEFNRDSSVVSLPQNDKIGAENDNLSGFAESALDSTNPQNLQSGLPRRFCESARNDEFIRDSSLRFLSAQNDNVGLDSAKSQNLGENSVKIAESTTFCYSKSYFCHSEQSEESKRNPSLRDFATQNRGNPPCKKTQDLQRGLPRRFCESARNDEFIRDSSVVSLPQNDKIGAENDNLSGFAESALDSALFYNKFFPIKFAESRGQFLPNTALIALGANLKNPIATFKSLFTKLARNAKIHILSTSPIYKNPPFGYANQPFFYNATILLATKMCLLEFYAFIFYLERIFGRNRKRAFKNAPRALDIDIIFFNDIFMRSKKLNIPHPQWQTRASVLVPLIFQVHYKGF